MLKSESQANEELSERIQDLERDLYNCKQDRDKALKQIKINLENKENLEFKFDEMQTKQDQKDEHINLLKKQLEKLSKENMQMKRTSEEQSSCNSCIDYIKQMKSFQFKVEDLSKEKDTLQL